MKNTYQSASEIGIGVIGYSSAFNMGRRHLTDAAAQGMRPVAVCDLDESRLAAAREDFPGINTYTHVPDMLADDELSMVVIITPHNTHTQLAHACMDVDKHVIVEKPFAITTEECDEMIAAAEERGLLLTTYHNRHWDGCILEALEHIRAGEIGEVVRIEAHTGAYAKPRDWWRTSRSISGGILYDWGVHLLDYSLQILDAPATEVMGFSHSGYWADETPWKSDTNEDEAAAVIRFAGGAYIYLRITTIDNNPKAGQMEITGTDGTYVFDQKTWQKYTTRDGERVVEEGTNPERQGHRFYENLASYMTGGEELIITPQWARRPVHFIDLAVKSALEGRALTPKYE